jgi:hypothetical protein
VIWYKGVRAEAIDKAVEILLGEAACGFLVAGVRKG